MRIHNFILRVLTDTAALKAYLSVEDTHHRLTAGMQYVTNFTYIPGNPAVSGSFSIAWSSFDADGNNAPSLTTPSATFYPAEPPALESWEISTTLRAARVIGEVPSGSPTGSRFSGVISVEQPDPPSPPADWNS